MRTWSRRSVYRLYSQVTFDHLYTAIEPELDRATRARHNASAGYVEEGVICRLLAAPDPPRSVPLRRLMPGLSNDHLVGKPNSGKIRGRFVRLPIWNHPRRGPS